jgi:hypothetical protein
VTLTNTRALETEWLMSEPRPHQRLGALGASKTWSITTRASQPIPSYIFSYICSYIFVLHAFTPCLLSHVATTRHRQAITTTRRLSHVRPGLSPLEVTVEDSTGCPVEGSDSPKDNRIRNVSRPRRPRCMHGIQQLFMSYASNVICIAYDIH